MNNEMDEQAKEGLPDMFAFGGYQPDDKQMGQIALLRPPANQVVVSKPVRLGNLLAQAGRVMKPALDVRSGEGYGAKVALLQLVVQRVWEGLMQEGVCRVEVVEYVSQLQHYPHITHCDFVLTEMDKKGFVGAVAGRFVKEFMKANAKAERMWFVVPTLPRDMEFGRLFEFGGIVMRGLCDYNVVMNQRRVRLDCLWAVATEESLICQTEAAPGLQAIGMESGGGQTRPDSTIPGPLSIRGLILRP